MVGLRSGSLALKAVPLALALLVLAAAPSIAAPAGSCTPDATTLCLNDARFAVSVHWTDFEGHTGDGEAIGLTGDTGYFWFFSQSNVELVVKVLDATGLNGHFWVFYGALSNVEYELTVVDTATGAQRTYANPSGRFGSAGDTTAFPSAGSSAPVLAAETERVAPSKTSACSTTALCLADGRFQVEVNWTDFQGNTGRGQAVGLTADTGYFWFFDSANVELVVKALDARAVNGNFWIFYGALSNVAYEVVVLDTETGESKRYGTRRGSSPARATPRPFPWPRARPSSP